MSSGFQGLMIPDTASQGGRVSAHCREQVIASLFAPAAGFCTDPAMLVHASMLFAFITAGLAGCPASLQDGAGDIGVVASVPGKDVTRCSANVSAVKVGPDALGQFRDHVLAQACIGAGRARLCTLKTGRDASRQFFSVETSQILRVGIKHRGDKAHRVAPSSGFLAAGREAAA
jgi:hypothetical protein